MSFIALVLSLAITFGPLQQSADTSTWEKRRTLYPELVTTFDLAETAPNALRSLALLSIASSQNLKDVEWKKELLSESFKAADQVSFLWPADYVKIPRNVPMNPVPKRVMDSEVSRSGLDKLSLQTSAIGQMAFIDAPGARKMAESLVPLHVIGLTCSDGLVPRVDAYYNEMGSLVTGAFPPKEKKEAFEFVLSVITAVSSPVEISPAVEMIKTQKFSAQNKSALALRFAQRLETLSGDSRSFLETLGSSDSHVWQLIESLDAGTSLLLLKAWRTYLVNNLNGPSCTEITDPNWPYWASIQTVVERFNSHIENHHDPLAGIAPTDIQPHPESAFPVEAKAESAAINDLHKKWFALEFGDGPKGLSDADKSSAEWQNQFEQYLETIDELPTSSPGESDLDLIRAKWDAMGSAIVIAPSGPLRDAAMARYVSLFKISNMPEELLPNWFYEVCSLVNLSEKFNNGNGAVLKLLQNSHDALLILVARLLALQSNQLGTSQG